MTRPSVNCPLAGKWRGCKFEGRWDETKQRDDIFGHFWISGTLTGKALPTDKQVYVRDVCVRCGRTIERESV